MTPDTFKPVHDLTAADMQAHAVWKYLADEEGPGQADESWVAPVASVPGLGEYGCYFVSGRFTLQNGQQLPGVVQVDILGRHITLEPLWIHANGKCIEVLGSDTARRLERILKVEKAQPARWELTLPLRGENRLRSARVVRSRWGQAAMLVAKLVRLRLLR